MTFKARIVQLGQVAARMASSAQQVAYGTTSSSSSSAPPAIRGIPANAWPNPLQPVAPIGPPNSSPLNFPFWTGQNLTYTPRPDAEYTAAELRSLATYPLARILIENVKDIVSSIPWQIGLKAIPGETQKDRAQRQKNDDNIVLLSRFFERPDRTTPNSDWSTWVRPLMDNLLVLDAGAVFIRRSKRNLVGALHVVLDGGGIARYIDENGFTPESPSAAYSQLWQGIPRTNFTTDELLYAVRNIVPRNTISSFLYGLGPTESIAQEIKVGIERLNFVMQYYSSGGVPDAIQIVPPGISPDKVRETQMANNAMLSGNLTARRQLTLLQGFQSDGKPDQILFPKEPLLADLFDEMHIRKLAYAYGDSAQRLQKLMNRSSAETSQEASETEGVIPWSKWLQGVANHIIQVHMGMPDYELTMKMERESDVKKQMETDVGYVKSGGYTWNERRELRGDDPRPEPQADQLGVLTANGWVKLGETLQAGNSGDNAGNDDSSDGSGRDDGPKPNDSTDKSLRLIVRGAG